MAGTFTSGLPPEADIRVPTICLTLDWVAILPSKDATGLRDLLCLLAPLRALDHVPDAGAIGTVAVISLLELRCGVAIEFVPELGLGSHGLLGLLCLPIS